MDHTDLNNILNYADFRAHEVKVYIDNNKISEEMYSHRLTSNSQVVHDALDLLSLKDMISAAEKIELRLTKKYPFHIRLIDKHAELCINHNSAFCCSVVYIKNSIVSMNNNEYWFEIKNNNLIEFKYNGDVLHDKYLLCFYKTKQLSNEYNWELFTDRNKGLLTSVTIHGKEMTPYNESFTNHPELYEYANHVVKKMPYKYYGKLSGVIDLSDNFRKYFYYLQKWEYEYLEIINERNVMISNDHLAKRTNGGYRIINTDRDNLFKLLNHNIGGTESDNIIINAKNTTYCVYREPNIYVKTNGYTDWHVNGSFMQGMFGREGEIYSIGHKWIKENVTKVKNKKIIICGLGLGILQRNYMRHNFVVTVECDKRIIDLYRYYYKQDDTNHHIVIGDFFEYIHSDIICDYLIIDAPIVDYISNKTKQRISDLIKREVKVIVNINSPNEKELEFLRNFSLFNNYKENQVSIDRNQYVFTIG
jgi:hypothetical protein